MLFDSHCHLTDPKFNDLPAVLARARAAGVARLVTVCSDADDAERALALASARSGIWGTAGVQPHAAAAAAPGDLDRIAQLLQRDEVVAVGETGLDYFYDHSPRQQQRALLDQHLQLAADSGKPVVLHSRDADADTIAMLKGAGGGVGGVLHCFAGGPDLLSAGLDAGWMISFSGLVSFKNYTGAELVRAVPAERLLIETDSPYLAPIPHRGQRNEPAFVRDVAVAIARLRGSELSELAALTTANALRFYGLAASASELAEFA